MKVLFQNSLTAVIIAGIFLIIHQQHVAGAYVYSMKETCKHYSGWISDPSDCSSAGYCSGGELIGSTPCPGDLLWDSKKGLCTYANAVDCLIDDISNICRNVENPKFLAHPTDCSKYCYCQDSKSKPEINTCPEGQVYNPNIVGCSYKEKYDCNTGSICRLIPDKKFAADPNPANCGNYVTCFGGVGDSKPCDPGFQFNPLIGKCDPKYNCQNNGGGGGDNPTTLPPNSASCAAFDDTKPADPKNPYQYFPDGTTCAGSYACSSKTGPGTWVKCPQGFHFNNGQCVTPFTFACPHDRCDNLALNFVTNIESDCKEYTLCKNYQSTNIKGACDSPGYPYLDEYEQRCRPDQPDYAICK